MKGVNKANNPDVVPYGLPLPDDDEAPAPVPAGPDVAASVVLPQDYNEQRDEKAKVEKSQSKAAFIGFLFGFFIVISLFVKLVFVWVYYLQHLNDETVEVTTDQYETVRQIWQDDTIYIGHVHNGLPDGLGIATQVDGTVYNGQWRAGLREGFGTETDGESGDHYVGQFHED